MNATSPQYSVYPGGDPSRKGDPPGREFQELWFALAQKPWASLVIVPADGEGSTATIATKLAEVGTRLRETPVTAIVTESLDYASVRSLLDLQPRIHDFQALPSLEIEARVVPVEPTRWVPPEPSATPVRSATPMLPSGRVLIAIRPVVVEPLGVAIAQAADAVVLCINMGATRAKDARRSIELIGRERILGSILVR